MASTPPTRPHLRSLPPPPADPPQAPTPSPESRLIRSIQAAIDAFAAAAPDAPMPRQREKIRLDLHAAVDSFMISKLQEVGRMKAAKAAKAAEARAGAGAGAETS